MLAAGRVFSGVALGLAMAVGGSWIKELSSLPWGEGDGGARRAAMSLTAGFGVGAGVAGVLAQWGPWPAVLPALLVDQAQRAPVAFSALLCVVTLGCGFVIQSLGRRITRPAACTPSRSP